MVPQEPLAAIRDVLSLSIHEVVNDPGHKCRVLDFYRIVRKIENEAWLRRSLQERRDEDWIAAHLSRRVPDDRVG